MRLIKFLLCSFISFLFSSYIAAHNLSETATISLLTASPMSENLVSSFGHTALRVHDPEADIDHVFNYGMFDQSISGFTTLTRVFRGVLQCEMWVAPFDDFLDATQKENRRLIEHVFNLSQEEKNYIWHGLINNAKEENRKYIFDFFFRNCTTFPRDLITNNIGKEIVLPDYLGHQTYRQINAQYALSYPWFNFFLDLISGRNVDAVAPLFKSLYIPQELEKAWNLSYVLDNNGERRPLFATSEVLIQGVNADEEKDNCFFTPLLCSLILLVIVLILSVIEWKKNASYKWLDFILFGTAGLFGIAFYIFKLGLAHWYLLMDWMLLWIQPFHLLVVVFMLVRPQGKVIVVYHIINVVLLTFLMTGAFFLTQYYNAAFIPLMACLWVRSILFECSITKKLR